MRRVSKAIAVTSLLIALTTSNIYALPSKSGSQPSVVSKIIRIVRQVIGLDTGDMSWPKP
ncbi:MAG: hypothetical protein QOF63_3377 [Thermoanaerobaculia bacterium]|jgi:hypothetical protein|nr:hypothetical protein [Thermoanaerobaculia bacterium]